MTKIFECFASQQNTKAVATLSSYDIAKTLPTSYFEYFGDVWLLPSKMIMPAGRNFDVPNFYLRYFFFEITCYFDYFKCLIMPINNDSITLWETLTPKVLKSTCRKL